MRSKGWGSKRKSITRKVDMIRRRERLKGVEPPTDNGKAGGRDLKFGEREGKRSAPSLRKKTNWQ